MSGGRGLSTKESAKRGSPSSTEGTWICPYCKEPKERAPLGRSSSKQVGGSESTEAERPGAHLAMESWERAPRPQAGRQGVSDL